MTQADIVLKPMPFIGSSWHQDIAVAAIVIGVAIIALYREDL